MQEQDRNFEYMMRVRPILNKEALHFDETEGFLSPCEPNPGEQVQFTFRCAKNNLDSVYLIICSDAQGEPLEMKKTRSGNGFDYYSCTYTAGKETIRYYFELRLGRLTCYYNKLGVGKEPDSNYDFRLVPGFRTPEWAKGAVMYQIFVDRFYNGDSSNDVLSGEYSYIQEQVRKIDDWNHPIEGMDVRNFYGGDLQGVLEKLPYLQELGIEAIYLNPIFVSPSNHKYDTQDYDYVDPHFGVLLHDEGELLPEGSTNNAAAGRYIDRVTSLDNLEASNRLFQKLVEEAHSRGIRMIIDGVFNHCGSFNKWMDRELIYEGNPDYPHGAFVSESSPYQDYFQFATRNWPYNESYDGWWGHKTLPKLNYEASDQLKAEMFRIAKKWVSEPYCVDGWRLDVAADLGHSEVFNHAFWKGFRSAVKEANPEAVIIAEHYGDCKAWLQGDEWDTIMNYDAFMEPISWFLTGMEKHSDGFREDLLGNADVFYDTMRYQLTNFPMSSRLTAMNQLDNHDHSRFLTRTNHCVGRLERNGRASADEGVDPAVLREAVIFQMGWPGAPTLYYGDEAGVCGFTDPDNRRVYPWGHEDQGLIAFYRAAIAMHKRYRVLKTGSVRLLTRDTHVISFLRFNQEELAVFVLNNRKEPYTIELPVWIGGLDRSTEVQKLRHIFHSGLEGFTEPDSEAEAAYGVLKVVLQPESAEVFYTGLL